MKQSLYPNRGEKQEDEGIKDKQMIIVYMQGSPK
jgi:hypothetical protein